jgi:hypothetical protein
VPTGGDPGLCSCQGEVSTRTHPAVSDSISLRTVAPSLRQAPRQLSPWPTPMSRSGWSSSFHQAAHRAPGPIFPNCYRDEAGDARGQACPAFAIRRLSPGVAGIGPRGTDDRREHRFLLRTPSRPRAWFGCRRAGPIAKIAERHLSGAPEAGLSPAGRARPVLPRRLPEAPILVEYVTMISGDEWDGFMDFSCISVRQVDCAVHGIARSRMAEKAYVEEGESSALPGYRCGLRPRAGLLLTGR